MHPLRTVVASTIVHVLRRTALTVLRTPTPSPSPMRQRGKRTPACGSETGTRSSHVSHRRDPGRQNGGAGTLGLARGGASRVARPREGLVQALTENGKAWTGTASVTRRWTRHTDARGHRCQARHSGMRPVDLSRRGLFGRLGSHTTGGEMGDLIGDGPRAEVDHLRRRLDDIRAGVDVPRVVILQGASGSGKSRIIREFYRGLQETQPTNKMLEGYWPHLQSDAVLDSGGGPDVRQMDSLRKDIAPAVEGFTRPAGTLPGFFWWSLNCGKMPGGSLVEVTAGLMPQLSAHLPYLAERWRTGIQGNQRFARFWKSAPKSAFTKASALKGDLTLESIGQALSALDVAAPGYGTMLTEVWHGAVRLRQHRSLVKDVAQGGALRVERSGAAEIVKQLSRVASQQLPVVLAVEDMHLMGAGLADLLDLLAQPAADFPVLVVASTWPTARNEVYRGWLEAARALHLVDLRRMPVLTADEYFELAAKFADDADAVEVRSLAQRFPNPWALTLAMGHPKLGGLLRQGAALEPATQQAPQSILDFYRDQWADLAPAVQEVMMAASVVAGSDESANEWPVMSTCVVAAGEPLWPGRQSKHTEAVKHSIAHQWVVQLDRKGRLLHFDEWLRAQIARRSAEDQLDDDQTRRLLDRYESHVAKWLRSNAQEDCAFTDPAVRAAAREYLERLQRRPEDADVIRLAVRAVADAQAAVLDTEQAVETWDRYIDPDDIDWQSPSELRDLHTLAVRVWASGDHERAIKILDEVLKHRDDLLGRRHEDTRKTRWDLARWNAEKNRYGGAIRLGEALVEDESATLGLDHEHTLTTRMLIAFWTGQMGRTERALELSQSLIPDLRRVLGPDHPDTLRTRQNIAFRTGQLGAIEKALKMSETLLPDQEGALGPDHPDTLTTRGHIAGWRWRLGQTEQSLGLFESLEHDQRRFLGSDHPYTLTTRHNIASLIGQLGRAHQSLRLLEELLPDHQRDQGFEDPDLQATATSIATWTGQIGRVEQALEILDELLSEQLRVLGADHPDTLTTRDHIAAWTGRMGDVDQAISLLGVLLRDRQRVQGHNHPDVMSTQDHISGWTRIAEALRSAGHSSPLGNSSSAADQLTLAIDLDSTNRKVVTLISGCRKYGTKQMVEVALSRDERSSRPESAFLHLVDSGYDPWQIGMWWSFPAAALGAALTAIEEGDDEDLRLILLLNRPNADTHGEALELLAGIRDAAELPDTNHRTTLIASLGYIAEWVVPGTPTAERAKDLRSRLTGQGDSSA